VTAGKEFRAALRDAVEGMEGVYAAGNYPNVMGDGRRRTRGMATGLTLTLIDREGVLEWIEGPVSSPYRGAKIVDRLVVEPLQPAAIPATLESTDRRLTPKQGLFAWRQGRLSAAPARLKGKRVLVFLHGTFSETTPLFRQLQSTTSGASFLDWATGRYDHILAFNHPTLAVSPLLNAIDLERAIGDAAAVDLVAHSRGALVARWWADHLHRGNARRRAALVGGPLGGTSLAAAPHLRQMMSWFSNLALRDGLLAAGATGLVPWLAAVAALARFAGVAAEGVIAWIPGLQAMARVSNNAELNRLRRAQASPAEYLTIGADYQPERAGWRVWRHFVDQPQQRAMVKLFAGANDTVVDLASMGELSESAGEADLICGPGPQVHHTNYFAQGEVVAAIEKLFGRS
jgi:hypothetical protein